MMRGLLTLLFGLALLPAGMATAAPLRIATGELPPYATQGRPDQGVALQVVRRAFALAGHEVQFHFMPWSRAQHETRAGRWDATAYWGASEQRRRDFLLSDTVLVEQWQMVSLRELQLDWQRLEDLRPWRIGVIRDYTYSPEFLRLLQAGVLQGDNTSDDLTGLRKLLLRRIDVLPIERNVACDLLARHFTPAEAGQLALHPRLLTDSFTTHLMLPPQAPRSAELLRDFNRGLRQLQASGEHARILASVKCPGGWAAPPSAQNPASAVPRAAP
jgi:polar amino acid transport system substrate-binding protein